MQRCLLWTMVAMLLLLAPAACLADKHLQYVDKDTLKSWLDDPKVMIIDVRSPKDWSGSDMMIKGAVRMDPGKSAAWGNTLPKDKKLVFYCA